MSADWYPGIRAFCAYWKHAETLQQTFETLERTFADEHDACIDAAKGIVECVCRILIKELRDSTNPLESKKNPEISALVGKATQLLKLDIDRHRPFSNLIKKHNELTNALRILRNEAGTVSHGKDGFIAKLSVHHQRSAVLAADAIITFLHEAYLEREPDPVRTLEPYEHFHMSNDLIDKHTVTVVGDEENGLLNVIVLLPGSDEVLLAVETSRLLFSVDREAYKLVLNACREAEAAMFQNEPQEKENS